MYIYIYVWLTACLGQVAHLVLQHGLTNNNISSIIISIIIVIVNIIVKIINKMI